MSSGENWPDDGEIQDGRFQIEDFRLKIGVVGLTLESITVRQS